MRLRLRKYLTWNLRSIFIAFTLASICFALIGSELITFRRQSVASRKLEQLGGVELFTDSQLDNVSFSNRCDALTRTEPHFFTKWLKLPGCDRIVMISFPNHTLTDEVVENVQSLPFVKFILLGRDSDISEFGMAKISDMRSLEHITISSSPSIDRECLMQLLSCKSLRHLNIVNCPQLTTPAKEFASKRSDVGVHASMLGETLYESGPVCQSQ